MSDVSLISLLMSGSSASKFVGFMFSSEITVYELSISVFSSSTSISVSILGGTGIYENISGYGLNKGEFNPETGYSSFEFTLKYTK